jgi:hypothetical protein
MFRAYADHDLFAHLVENIEGVVEFFEGKLEVKDEIESGKLLEEIEAASKSWTGAGLLELPRVKFEYGHEEEEAGAFFVGFTWSILYRNSLIYYEECQLLWEFTSSEDLEIELI